jgi:hypothetical protein
VSGTRAGAVNEENYDIIGRPKVSRSWQGHATDAGITVCNMEFHCLENSGVDLPYLLVVNEARGIIHNKKKVGGTFGDNISLLVFIAAIPLLIAGCSL